MLDACVLLFLVACQASNHAPVEDRHFASTPATQGVYVVVQDDTLFSIAWRHNRDYRELARINRINPPYVILPGQRLKLTGNPLDEAVKAPGPAPVPSPAQVERYKKDRNNNKEIQEKVANQRPVEVNISWQWPASGSIVRQFSSSGRVSKGIDIAGQRGDPVWAAAMGTVVYSGPGMVGYGNLIILRHDDEFLSAYAHNSKLLVKEGETAKAGQQIAEIGSSGTTRNQLHFEIRRHGKPVDPLFYLPKR